MCLFVFDKRILRATKLPAYLQGERVAVKFFFFNKMNNCVRIIPRAIPRYLFKMSNLRYSSSLGEPGSGAGKGGGGGGSIREAGGSFGKREAAQEDEYFYRKQKDQIAKLKTSLSDEISFHEEQIQRHKEAIERNKQRVEELSREK